MINSNSMRKDVHLKRSWREGNSHNRKYSEKEINSCRQLALFMLSRRKESQKIRSVMELIHVQSFEAQRPRFRCPPRHLTETRCLHVRSESVVNKKSID
ncbi:hypothetical protein TNCV_4072371 [Trichonephila clavipes]|uniref:Uncharacterized protein n=1 Tax=Trichonephila clavipes TaxID=2585209 RepID=A0A8X6W8N9_TRICX|nr:hypothetical protein TNCV_4072371 [Trichonephila clavipes]